MKTSTIVWLIIILAVAFGGWYWWTTQSKESAETEETVQEVTDTLPAAALSVRENADLGSYLVADNMMTLYTFANDEAGVSNCAGTCAENWPPYTVPAATILPLGDGVTGEFATIERDDGTLQVTYNAKPLYFWKNDTQVGDTTGHGVNDVWFVVAP